MLVLNGFFWFKLRTPGPQSLNTKWLMFPILEYMVVIQFFKIELNLK